MNVFRIVRARSAKQSGIIGGKKPFDPNIILLYNTVFEKSKIQSRTGTTNARTIIWHQFCFLLFFKLLKVLLDTELGVS